MDNKYMTDTFWKKPDGSLIKIAQLTKTEAKNLEKDGWLRFVDAMEYFREQGRLGGLKTLKKYGKRHYSKIRPNKGVDKGIK